MTLGYCSQCKRKRKIIEWYKKTGWKLFYCGHITGPFEEFEKEVRKYPELTKFSNDTKEVVKKYAPIFNKIIESKPFLQAIRIKYNEISAHPLFIVKASINGGDYFTAIILLVSFFEIMGKVILSSKLKGKISSERLKNLNVESIIILLYALKIIDTVTYCKTTEVQKFRNNILVHFKSNTELHMHLDNEQLSKIAEKGYEALVALWMIVYKHKIKL